MTKADLLKSLHQAKTLPECERAVEEYLRHNTVSQAELEFYANLIRTCRAHLAQLPVENQ